MGLWYTVYAWRGGEEHLGMGAFGAPVGAAGSQDTPQSGPDHLGLAASTGRSCSSWGSAAPGRQLPCAPNRSEAEYRTQGGEGQICAALLCADEVLGQAAGHRPIPRMF